jgi:chromosome segregation ATPase
MATFRAQTSQLVHDNEVLMKEVAELDAQLRQAVEEREAAVSANTQLLQEQQEQESTSQVSERMMKSMEAQTEMVRAEREELARQHAADREFLNGIFSELEAQLALARTEREELHTRSERERRGAAKRIKELEDALAAATTGKDAVRAACDREKEVLAKQFEQRVAGLRLEKEQAKLDKALLRRLEKELSELKALSTSVLGPLAQRGAQYPDLGSGYLGHSDAEAAAAMLAR